jgi:hypothetical protein
MTGSRTEREGQDRDEGKVEDLPKATEHKESSQTSFW